jgi:tetratricopeptide (TPR) repeat protein
VARNLTAATLLDEALDALDEGDPERAVELAVEGARLAGRADDEELQARLAITEGQARLALGDSRAALACITRGARAFPDDLDVQVEEATALHELSRFEEAAAILARVLEEDPGDAGAHWLLGLSLERLGRAAAAERHLARRGRSRPTTSRRRSRSRRRPSRRWWNRPSPSSRSRCVDGCRTSP